MKCTWVMKNLRGKLEADIIIKVASDCLISYATVLGLSRETTNRIYIDEKICYRKWLTQLQKPRSPTVSYLQVGEPGKVDIIQSESKGLRIEGLMM